MRSGPQNADTDDDIEAETVLYQTSQEWVYNIRGWRAMLELAKTVSFVFCILTLYHAAIHTFFIPGTRWRERLVFALVRLAFAACVCYLSGMLFVWPSPANPDRNLMLSHTPPVRLYLWGLACIAGLFVAGWFFSDLIQQCGPFITFRHIEKF